MLHRLMFVHLGVKVDEACYCDYVRSLASSYFSKTMPQHMQHSTLVSEINISQGSVATDLRYGEVFNNRLIPNFMLSIIVNKFLKSLNFW